MIPKQKKTQQPHFQNHLIQNHFAFLPGISKAIEQKIHSQGITDWNQFLKSKKVEGISKRRKICLDMLIRRAQHALYDGDSAYFTNKIKDTWLLYPHFSDQCIFLDIEATGVKQQDQIIVIGLFDGIDTKVMIKDVNLNTNHLKKELEKYKLIVTFNGSSFDIPFIQKRNPTLLPNVPHIDIRHVCTKLGLTGGLKKIEQTLDIKRDSDIVKRLHGGDPLKLWRMYKASGDKHYLNVLANYNEEDVINLHTILCKILPQLSINMSNRNLKLV